MSKEPLQLDDAWIIFHKDDYPYIKDLHAGYIETHPFYSYTAFTRYCRTKLGITSNTHKNKMVVWDDKWIENHANTYPSMREFYREYAKIHEVGTAEGFYSHVKRKLGSNNEYRYTDEQKSWIRENYSKYGWNGCAEPFNKRFGTHKTDRGIVSQAHRMGIYISEDDMKSHENYSRRVPIGTIVDDGDGYLKIKTGKGVSGWERYHRYIWEQRHGVIPKGYKVIFLNGNRQDYSEENLACVPAHYLALMNKYDLKSEDSRITETSVKWCDLYSTIKPNLTARELEEI